MRWNCPHCDEFVSADIDFETTTKSYVRCAKCKGLALIHRSAALADRMKATRMRNEARAEAAAAQSLVEIATTQGLIQAGALAPHMTSHPQVPLFGTPTPPPRTVTPPPFRMPAKIDDTGTGATAAAAPTFNYTNPPEFLMRANTTATRAFASNEAPIPMAIEEILTTDTTPSYELDTATTDWMESFAEPSVDFLSEEIAMDPVVETATESAAENTTPSENATSETTIEIDTGLSTAPVASTFAVWIAAAVAFASGAYLIVEGRKALSEIQNSAPVADHIVSKSNSAVRAEERQLVVVRVPRAILRTKPSIDGIAVQAMDRSTILGLLEVRDGWIRVESPKVTTSDRTAWVRADLVSRIGN